MNEPPTWEGLPSKHPRAEHLHRMEKDLQALGSTAGGMHPANLEALAITEWLVAACDDTLPSNVQNYCADRAVLGAKVRAIRRAHELREQAEVAAQYVAAEYAAQHMPDDAGALVQDE